MRDVRPNATADPTSQDPVTVATFAVQPDARESRACSELLDAVPLLAGGGARWPRAATVLAQLRRPPGRPPRCCGLRGRRAPSRRPPADPGRSSIQIAPCFEAQGNLSLIEPADLPLLHPAEAEPAVGRDVWVPYDEESEQIRPRRLPAASGAPTSSTTLSIETDRLHFPNGVDRQDRHLQHGGAAAGQDRRLRRLQEGRDRRRSTRSSRSRTPQIRLDTFIDPGAHPKGRGHRPRDAEGEGLPVRRTSRTRSRRSRAGRSWCT